MDSMLCQYVKVTALSLLLAGGAFVPGASAQVKIEWSKGTTSGQPTARHESAAAVIDGKLYLIGGRGDRPLDILDIASGQWRTGAAAPVEMNHTQAVVLDKRI